MMWRQALFRRVYASHVWREPTHLEQVGSLCRREEEQRRQRSKWCLRVDAAYVGQDGDEGSHVQNVTVSGAAVPGPEPV